MAAVGDEVRVKATGEVGRITQSNGHAYKVCGVWVLALDVGPAEDEATQRERRISEAIARGEAPILPKYLLPPLKRPRAEPAPSTGEAGEKGKGGKGGGKDKGGKGDEQAWKKQKRGGQNKAKDRSGNQAAFKIVRDSQLCTKMAYLNSCEDADAAAAGTPGRICRNGHDAADVLAAKPPPIADECPILKAWGVCPSGLNCRFGGHIVDGKNVDGLGVPLAPGSDWCNKIEGMGHPIDEINVFDYTMVKQLRGRVFDFSRAYQAEKDWQKYCSMEKDEKFLGSLGDFERKPINFNSKTILAPLTTVGNLPFRRLCVGLGCEVTVAEMALASSITDGGPSDLSLLRRHKCEKIFGVQVAGGDIETMAKVAQFIDEKVDCDFVDINCGCPLEELHRRGAGSRLMCATKKLEGIVRCMSSVLKTKPLTLKMRTAHFEDAKSKAGDFNGRIAHLLVPQLETWGVSAITLHGRTARQRYTKLADWDYVKECSSRRTRSTPFIACGDVLTWEDVEKHRESHGTDTVMIARGALIKPWIFTEIAERRHWDISANERFDMMRNFCNYGLEHWGSDARGVENTRRFLLEWLSFTCRYVPIGLLETMPPMINWRPRPYIGRSDLETKLASPNAADWVEISEMFLGKVPDGFSFTPKHKSASYESVVTASV